MRRADRSLMGNVQNLYYSNYPNCNKSYVSYLFANQIYPHKTLIEIHQQRLIGAIAYVERDIFFNGRFLKTPVVFMCDILKMHAPFTVLENMFAHALNSFEHNSLLTIANCDHKTMYEQFGFEVVYRRRQLTITRNDVSRSSNDGCILNPKASDLLKIYAQFCKRFNGFCVRSQADFEQLLSGLIMQNAKIIAYQENGVLKGYALCRLENKVVYIDECIYFDSTTLLKLLNVALQQRPTVYLRVSEHENLSVLFPKCEEIFYDYMMVKVNDISLFNRLYNANIQSTADFINLSKKPMYLSEVY